MTTATRAPMSAIGAALERLWDERAAATDAVRGWGMPPEVRSRYGGDLLVELRSDRPTVVANFVTTLDGIVALGSGELSGGGRISGFHEPDRFVMALLRALADVVLVGAGTVRGSTHQRWVAGHLQPQLEGAVGEWRESMGLAAHPTTVVVTARGEVPADHPGLNDRAIPVAILTTPAGAANLRAARLSDHVRVQAVGPGPELRAADVLDTLSNMGARLVLSEGGPHLLGQLVEADLLDELFLTLSPQLAGREGTGRLGLVEGIGLPPEAGRWHALRSVRRSGNHLFLRYRRTDRRQSSEEAHHA